MKKIVTLYILAICILFFGCRHPERPATFDISGLPETEIINAEGGMNNGRRIKNEDYVYYCTIERSFLSEDMNAIFALQELVAYEMIEGHYYKYFASFKGLPSNEWVARFSSHSGDLSKNSGFELFKSVSLKNVPDYIRDVYDVMHSYGIY